MSDDKHNRGNPDRKEISLEEDYEVEYWTKKFGVSKAKLQQAVNAVGHSAMRVEEYLKQLR